MGVLQCKMRGECFVNCNCVRGLCDDEANLKFFLFAQAN